MMVEDTAKLSVFVFTANIPRTEVNPSRGRRMTDAFTRALWTIRVEEVCICNC